MNTVTLQKGGNISLTKAAPNMTNMLLGLGWKARETEGVDFDLDASVYMLTTNEKVRSDSDFVFYAQPKSPCGSVVYHGDNQEGGNAGSDAEEVTLKLNDIPTDIAKIVVVVTIYNAQERGQNFGQVESAYIRAVNEDTKEEIARFDLTEDAALETGMLFGEIYRHNGEWKFKAIGQGITGGLLDYNKKYNVKIT